LYVEQCEIIKEKTFVVKNVPDSVFVNESGEHFDMFNAFYVYKNLRLYLLTNFLRNDKKSNVRNI